MNTYIHYKTFDINQLHIVAKIHNNKERISMYYGPKMQSLSFLTPPALTWFPRVTGQGDFGSPYGPDSVEKARFTLDMNNYDESHPMAPEFQKETKMFLQMVEAIDNALLDFMFGNQLKWLGRKNLSREEVKLFQILSVKTPINKDTGMEREKRLEMKRRMFINNQEQKINICDMNGKVVPNGEVHGGDIVCATMHVGSIYNGVGGDKFGISWELEDVQVVCQVQHQKQKENVNVFQNNISSSMAHEYTTASTY
jgi:hypothetical protein